MNDSANFKLDPEQVPKTTSSTYGGNVDELHNLVDGIEATASDPLAAIRDDPNYAALIRDLEYIALEARRLFEPAQETPSDRVWENIQKELDADPAEK